MGGSGRRMWRIAVAACVAVSLTIGTADAQTSGDPNPGAITLTGSMDASNAYLFRGIPQDDTGSILWPAFDLSLALHSGRGTLRSVTASVATWNSLHTGVTGLDGPSGKLWYESDFSATLGLGFGGGIGVGTTYTAYESPNGSFATVKELSFKITSTAYGVAPYALLAFELEGQADGGFAKGRYLEIGAAPSVPVPYVALVVPIKVGLSLDNYYESLGQDERFGFFSVGANASVPISSERSRYGRWNLHAQAEYVRLGDANALRLGENSKVIISAGIGFSY
jgi:hypothetical protein